ncbi:amino acid ABC transporter ATP-binding protein [Atopococcus tabaci]|uniref:amino acid ABC transporter ATP-binding protein n=1 Tax=Atopococcus tabaci TaxID=269774 RepID=UPI000428EBBB|nr:ATP-binding cassette domain-containing protein [Atopococcus tabaci]
MALKAEKISKSFSGVPVLKDFSLTIQEGEIIALVGKSGTGKTTFMRILNRLEKADSGKLSIGDTVLFQSDATGAVHYADKAEQKRYTNKIGMVFQNYQLFPNMTVLENCIEAPLAQKLMSKQDAEKKAEELLGQMGLLEKKDAYPSTLSGGQQQRVAIARAMMLNPDILCFDEPTSALDRESASGIGKMIQEIAAAGTGILLVTHDLAFSEAFSTRMVSSDEFLSE